MNIGDIIIIWLHENYQSSFDQIRSINRSFKSFNDADQCVDFFTEITNRKVYLILSMNYSLEIFISLIHDVSQLDSIYI